MTDCRGDSRKSSYSSGDNNHFDITGYERKKIKQNIWKRRGEEETGAAAQGDRENKVVCMVDGRYDMREIVVPPSRWVSHRYHVHGGRSSVSGQNSIAEEHNNAQW